MYYDMIQDPAERARVDMAVQDVLVLRERMVEKWPNNIPQEPALSNYVLAAACFLINGGG